MARGGTDMMNPFRTIPKLIQAYIETMRFNRHIPEFEKLREEGKIEEEKELIHSGQKRWIEVISEKLHMHFDVTGYENVPDDGVFMIYSNHQSYADVPAILWLMKDHSQIGFVAKDEFRKVKPIADAIEYTRSLFLLRSNPKEAVRVLSEAKKLLDQGFKLAIFPEGGRSRCHEMQSFKPGAFKFAEKAKVPILPITIDGSYKFFEEKNSYQPCDIKITVHPLVHIEEMERHQQNEAAAQIEATIRAAL